MGLSLGWYLAAPEHRPQWIRVDRVLGGEHGIAKDTPCGRQELERLMEARRGCAVEKSKLDEFRNTNVSLIKKRYEGIDPDAMKVVRKADE